MSIISTMGIARQALNVSEAAMNVVSNNIANMNTDGYSKEEVVLAPAVNYTPLTGSNSNAQAYSGTGVMLENVERNTDAYLLAYYRQQNSGSSYYTEYKTVGASIEQMTNELTETSGLEKAFTTFYEAANTLTSSPSSDSARSAFAQAAVNISSQFNQIYTDLDDLRTSLVGKVNADGTKEGLSSSKLSDSVTQVNSLLDQIISINKDIVKTSANGNAPNALLDQRDQIITQLSEYLPVSVTSNTNGTDNISINGVNVIQGTESKGSLYIDESESTADVPSVLKLRDSDGNIVSTSLNKFITTGTIGAILDVAGTDSSKLTISGVLGNLNTLAKGFADEMNRIQTATETTTDSSGKTVTTTPLAIDSTTQKLITSTENLFSANDGTTTITAGNISVNSKVVSDPNLIAAAREDVTSTTYDSTSIGNNTNATAFLNSRSSQIAGLNNSNPEDYLSSFVGTVGVQVANVNTRYTNQETVLTQVSNQLESISGVDLNEEIVDLTKYQRAYEASARIFSVCNSLLETLVNLGK